MLILSDDFADEDLIGHADYCDGLVEMIRSVKSRGSFTIGVYGQWGTGKTSLLRQVKDALDVGSNDQQPVLSVWFNPWQFVSEEHLIIPFFHTLIASLEKSVEETQIERIKVNVTDFLKKIANVPLALAYGTMVEVKIPFVLKSQMDVSKIMEHQQRAEESINKEHPGKADIAALQSAGQGYESLYYNLLQHLQDAAANLGVKIVVLIDDLDRCLPERAVELLEGLKVLLDLKNFVFVMGVAHEVIERGIRVRYRELYLTGGQDDLPNIEGQYLDKIIQFPFTLPAADPVELKKNILSKQLGELEGAAQYVEMVHEALGNNPRTIKRFINAISFSLHLAGKIIETDKSFYPGLLIKTSLIGYLLPGLYRQLEKYPSHLVMLERIIRETVEERDKKRNVPGEEFIEGQSHQIQKTDLPIIDQWLEDDKIVKLLPILKVRTDQQVDNDVEDIGFNNTETVKKYVRLMATSLQSEATSKAKDSRRASISLHDQMRDRMVPIKAGKFKMGDDGIGFVEVTLSPFRMDKYPVTQALYQQVMANNPSRFKGEDRPVEKVSWFDAIEFCNALSRKCGLDEAYDINGEQVNRKSEANGYRLPTEAEWEYACRAGTKGDSYGDLDEVAWYSKNSDGETHGVGQKKANDFGLYDMLGNVWEWCGDRYGYYSKEPVSDPVGVERGSSRVIRGGSWYVDARGVRSTNRLSSSPGNRYYFLGFRLVLPPAHQIL